MTMRTCALVSPPMRGRPMTRFCCALVLLAISLAGAACSQGDDLREEADGSLLGKVEAVQLEERFDPEANEACIGEVSDTATELTEIELVPCEERHELELYAQEEVADVDVYPGDSELQAFADVACLGSFGDFVGADYFSQDQLYFSYLYPTFDSWTEGDDRQVLCVVGVVSTEDYERWLTDSVRNSGGDPPVCKVLKPEAGDPPSVDRAPDCADR